MVGTPRRVDGADISHHQQTVDLRKARDAGLKFMYHKATEGNTYVDPRFVERLTAARSLGLPVGGYHFARPLSGDAIEEAKHFLKWARPQSGDLKPALDLEVMAGMTQAALRVWCENFSKYVLNEVGVLPVLYGPWPHLALREQVKWVPRYNDAMVPPTPAWDIWQFSNGVYGSPNSFPGLGHVDLNTFNQSMTLKRLMMPTKRRTRSVKMVHVSMQFSDSPRQQRIDVGRIFARAVRQDIQWITGTEAGPGNPALRKALRELAPTYGYRVYVPDGTDSWIAVRKDTMKSDRWEPAYTKVIDGVAGQYTDKGPVSVTFDTALGVVTVIACHYLTDKHPMYAKANKALALAIGEVAALKGKGRALVFYGGDQNIVDITHDTFFGAPLTSCWDELKRWENTGHGCIDVIASYDRDGRVACKSADALSDKELPLFTDHYWVRATYNIEELAS